MREASGAPAGRSLWPPSLPSGAPTLPGLTLCTYIPSASVSSFRPVSPGSPPCSSRFLTNVKVMISSGFAAWPAALARDLREGWYRLFCLCRDRVPQHSGILNITSAGRRVQADSVLGSSWPALVRLCRPNATEFGVTIGPASKWGPTLSRWSGSSPTLSE